ncbi:hypothetical protein M378DRAFT_121307 [Amanita muscaria Koide BX008]|uniref:Uncharacterized protein n=1 Tax=Amanita muscaria (strain Koide BX008) TaxID=946122 RepID=A0A0C2TLX9_AMAMK|nr:hypothetical protein M378DRAFT_121307 [Amanita muscaria Koide BX008]
MAQPSGLRSPQSPRSDTISPLKSKFDNDALKAYIKKLLSSTLQSHTWAELKDRDKLRASIKEITERVKERMLLIQPRGFKYVVLTQINENLGQGGRVDISCHWQEGDCIAQEMFTNDSVICTCIALAIS